MQHALQVSSAVLHMFNSSQGEEFIHSFLHSFIMYSVNPYKFNQPIGYGVCHNVNVI